MLTGGLVMLMSHFFIALLPTMVRLWYILEADKTDKTAHATNMKQSQ